MLAADGYAPNRCRFFIWEGVTQYLSESGVRATFLGEAARGSRLAFTHVCRDFLDGKETFGPNDRY